MVYSLISITFDSPQLDQEICSILIFLEKGQGIVSLPHIVYDFSKKMFLMLYSINNINFIA